MSTAAALQGPHPWKIDRPTYHRLGREGSFDGRRVQLVDGVVIEMSPMGAPRADVVTQLTRWLIRTAADEILVRVQLPLALSVDGEPEPDFALVPSGRHRGDHPSTALLVIEVADSSLAFDLGPKALLYARAKIPEYWVIDLEREETVVHRTPRAGKYTSVRKHGTRHQLVSVAVPSVRVQLAALM